MKHLILGDCSDLIKFILFGDDDKDEKKETKEKEKNEESEMREPKRKESEVSRTRISVPRNLVWPGESFINDDDLDNHNSDNKLKDNEEIRPENNMELAIYHCKGKFNY